MKKAFSVIMSLMLLLSSSGIAYAQHFCGDHKMISKITLGEEHLSCGMVMEVTDCDDEPKERDCCDNEYTKVDTDDRFVKADFQVDLSNTFLPAFFSVFLYPGDFGNSNDKTIYTTYRPPPLFEDLLVLYETFLI